MVKKKVTKVTKIPLGDMVCKDCEYAYLMRSCPFNPIVAECTKTKERHVASSPKNKPCQFKPRVGEMVIHEMIYLK